MYNSTRRFLGLERNEVLTLNGSLAYVYRDGVRYTQEQNRATQLNRSGAIHDTLAFVAALLIVFPIVRILIKWNTIYFSASITLIGCLLMIVAATAARWSVWIITTWVITMFEPPLIEDKENTTP